jgi:hypothetical protein
MAPLVPIRGSVDAIITVRTDPTRIGPCLAAVREQLPRDASVIVVDLLGAEPEKAPLHAEITQHARDNNARVTRNGQGQWPSRDRAAAAGVAPLMLFLDGDCVMQPNAWQVLLDAVQRDHVAVAGGVTLWDQGEGPPEGPPFGIKFGGWAIGVRGLPFSRFVRWSIDNPKLYKRDDLQAVSASFFLTRRTVYRTLGGFRGDYGDRPFADVSFCVRARSLGFINVFDPAARALSGPEPLAGGLRELQEAAFILTHDIGNIVEYDEWRTL